MDDLISRQALCEYALNQKDKSVTPNDIMRFPSAQPKKRTENTRKTHGVCLDAIDRQATLDWLKNEWNGMITSLLDGIKALPSAQPEIVKDTNVLDTDTISRQEAIEAINKIFPADPMRDDYTQGITCGAALANIYVAQLPSAQPEIIRCKDCKHWLDIDDGQQKHRMCADVYGDWFCADAERRTDGD